MYHDVLLVCMTICAVQHFLQYPVNEFVCLQISLVCIDVVNADNP